MKSKVGILGGVRGQLGHMLTQSMHQWTGHKVITTDRSNFEVSPHKTPYSYFYLLDSNFHEVDVVVNCVGATKPHFNNKSNLIDNLYTNAIFPHIVAEWAERRSKQFIHITTDCVFDGANGLYDENSPHTATDDYGRSKSLGEPSNAMVLRTSIIGTEIVPNPRFLISWMLKNKNGTVNGFTNHYWNGMTTLQLSKCIHRILSYGLFQHGTYHLHGEDINKADLLRLISKAFDLNVSVKDIEAPEFCDRRLRSVKELQQAMIVPSHDEMLLELALSQGYVEIGYID